MGRAQSCSLQIRQRASQAKEARKLSMTRYLSVKLPGGSRRFRRMCLAEIPHASTALIDRGRLVTQRLNETT